MLRFLTAGESHGQGLVAVIEGFPAGVEISREYINRHLARRQSGYGRGGRMLIEKDVVEIISGVRNGLSLGSPITLLIRNKDWENWSDIMSPDSKYEGSGAGSPDRRLTKPRPGHADLTGGLKYGHTDLRNVLERSSARETAARVAAGAVARILLEALSIKISSHVVCIGSVAVEDDTISCLHKKLHADPYAADASPVRCLDTSATGRMLSEIDAIRSNGDSIGGIFEVLAYGLPPGLGSYTHWDRRLDARLASAVMGIQAVKGVEFGIGFEAGRLPGSQVHDEIFYDDNRGYYRATNNAGGLEGGMTNGEDIVLRAVMKPIPTLYKPLRSVDIEDHQPFTAGIERSDVCAVPAAAVVGEAAVSLALADAVLEKTGGDSLAEVKRNLLGYENSLGSSWLSPRSDVKSHE